jgi:hypothetical protein
MLLTMSGSVQNDTLALALGTLALLAALAYLSDRPRRAAAAGIGGLTGLAVLAKLTTIVLVPAIAGWLVWRHRSRSLAAAFTYVSTVVITSGWWFVRNEVLYGDITAAKGVPRTGVRNFPPFHIQSVGGIGHILEELVTYLWLPTEYLRNSITASDALKVGLALLTALIVAVSLRSWRRSGVSPLITSCGLISVLGWLVIYVGYQAAAPRLAYMALPLWIVMIAIARGQRRRRAGVAVTVIGFMVLNLWTLYQIHRVPPPPSPIDERAALATRPTQHTACAPCATLKSAYGLRAVRANSWSFEPWRTHGKSVTGASVRRLAELAY